jgi:hypothetical protein
MPDPDYVPPPGGESLLSEWAASGGEPNLLFRWNGLAEVGLCTLNQVDPYPITYDLSNP